VRPREVVVHVVQRHRVRQILHLGVWIWIWLIVASANNKKAQPVDGYGNPIVRLLTAQQIAARQEQRRQQLVTVAVEAAIFS